MSVGTMKDGNYLEVAPGASASPPAELLARIAALENEVSMLKAQKATEEQFGLVKLSNDSDVTDSTGLAVPTSELNSTKQGTFANQINKLVGYGGFRSVFMRAQNSNIVDCNNLPIGYCGYAYDITLNSPSANSGWYVFSVGINDDFKFQIAIRQQQFAFRYYKENQWNDWKII